MMHSYSFLFQETCKEIEAKQAALDKLTQRYNRLAPNDPELAASQVGPLKAMWSSLVNQIDQHTASRRDYLNKCTHYHQKHSSVNSDVDSLLRELDRAHQAEELPLQERHALLQVSL